MKENNKNFLSRLKRLSHHFKRSVVMSWKASPILFLLRIGYELISIVIPILSLYLSKTVINILSSGNYEAQKRDFYTFIAFVVLLQLSSSLLGKLNGYISGLHADRFAKSIDMEIIDKINELDISYFDNPEFYDQMQNAMKDSRYLQGLAWISISLVKSIIQLITNFVILIQLNVIFPFIIIAFSLPGVFMDKYVAKRKYNWQLKRSRNDRKLGYTKNLLLSKGTAKDIRLFGTREYFTKKFEDMWFEWYVDKKKLEKQKLTISFSASILPHLATTGVLIYVGTNIFSKILTLGDYSFYSGITNQLLGSITTFTGVINQSYESEIRLSKYADFLKLEPLVKNVGIKQIDEIETIEFKNVSFKYPKTERMILNNVSFDIKKNRSLALVGLNGAGKTTIVKLLLRLYDPDEGKILVNGINLKEYDIKSYHKCIGVVFQDFCKYDLKMREAVALSDIDGANDDSRVLTACKNADFNLGILDHEKGIDTYLGKIFDPDGVVLSGGNWQKIAIAQAYFKNSSLMVFDEPNAALDPNAERRLFDKIEDLSRDKCVVYVTHRLSSATSAGEIIVINNGVCYEKGTHKQLMEQNGLYSELFSKQAENYKD